LSFPARSGIQGRRPIPESRSGGKNMRLSARNILKGKVKQVKPGVVNSEVIVELAGGGEVVAIITKSSADNLGLVKGKDVYAVIKASNVMIGVD
jgi:molybdopterin-binding protein